MRIEQLRNAPDRAGRYWVTFSDGTRLGLYRQTVEDFGLYPGKELEEAELARLQKAAGQMSAKMRAVRIVSASSVSRKDLEQRLVRKGEDPEQAKAAVAWMEDLHLVDDREMCIRDSDCPVRLPCRCHSPTPDGGGLRGGQGVCP